MLEIRFMYSFNMRWTPRISLSCNLRGTEVTPGTSRMLKCERVGPDISMRRTCEAKFFLSGPVPLLIFMYLAETFWIKIR